MNSVNTNAVMNRLLSIHARSLPMYLSDAVPWMRHTNGKASETLRLIVADQRAMVDRIGEMIVEHDGIADHGGFPMTFTSLHDLSFDYLLQKLIDYQRRDIQQIEECVEQLHLVPRAKALAEESLGAAKAHLESLEELAAEQEAGP